jgi:predicted RNA-binding protein with PUA-like domain
MAFWLMKSEPDAYGIDQLRAEGTTLWDGIRNYQARNFMRSMQPGDRAFFYHSNCKPPGIVAKSREDAPRWDCARLRFLGEFNTMLSLDQLRELYSVEQLPVTKRGNRLSILPVPEETAGDLLNRLGALH